MPTDPEVHMAALEFKRLAPFSAFGDERDYDLIRKVLEAAERERAAASHSEGRRRALSSATGL